MQKVGIIGGSGLDNPDILKDRVEVPVAPTPFGAPSDGRVVEGTIGGVPCVLISRHGRKHDIMPTNVNSRANMYTLRARDCTHVIVTTACGSLQDKFAPGEMVFIDDFIDRTSKRPATFFDGTCSEFAGVCHLPMTDLFSCKVRTILKETADELGFKSHQGGVMATIEGPRFSTRAESHMLRGLGGQLVNMSTVPEVVLANELGLVYASIAMVTDYDSWREDAAHCSVEDILKTFKQNAHKAISVITNVIPKLATVDWSEEIEAKRVKVPNSIV